MTARFPSRFLIMDDAIVNKRAASYFRKEILESLLSSRQAYDLIWARAVKCSCRANDLTEQPDPTCPVCYGVLGNLPGWRYVHPHPDKFPEFCDDVAGSVGFDGGERIRGLVIGMSADDQRNREGTWLAGTAMISVQPAIQLGYWDRLIMADAVQPYDQTLRRIGDHALGSTLIVGRDETQQLRYPIVDVLDLRTVAARYREREDYTLDQLAGTLSWLPGRGPANGIRFSIKYRCHPRWIVQDFPRVTVGHRYPGKELGKSGNNFYGDMPQRASCKLDFLL